MTQTVDHRHQTLDLGKKIAISSLVELSYYIRFTKELGYLDINGYEELWTKSQEGLKTLQGLISYNRKVWCLKSEVQCLNRKKSDEDTLLR